MTSIPIHYTPLSNNGKCILLVYLPSASFRLGMVGKSLARPKSHLISTTSLHYSNIYLPQQSSRPVDCVHQLLTCLLLKAVVCPPSNMQMGGLRYAPIYCHLDGIHRWLQSSLIHPCLLLLQLRGAHLQRHILMNSNMEHLVAFSR